MLYNISLKDYLLIILYYVKLLYFKVLEPSDRKVLTNVTRWFTTCINQPQFLKVLGKIALCEKMVPVTTRTTTVTNASPAVNSAEATTNGQYFSEI